MESKDAVKIALHVSRRIKADYSYRTQTFEYAFVTAEGSKVRNPSDSYSAQTPFCSLTFYCQASADMNEGKPYAWSLEYRDVGTVDLSRCESMLKTLKAIAKAESKFPVRPETFGQFVALHCAALKVTLAVQDQSEGNWHNETEHTFWKASDIQWLVDRQVTDFLTANADGMLQAKGRC